MWIWFYNHFLCVKCLRRRINGRTFKIQKDKHTNKCFLISCCILKPVRKHIPKSYGHYLGHINEPEWGKLGNLFNVSGEKVIFVKSRETLTSLWSEKLHYKFIESAEDGDFMLALNAARLLRTTHDCIHINKQPTRGTTIMNNSLIIFRITNTFAYLKW